MSLLKSAATVGGYTLLSRILGFVRDIIVASKLGAGPLSDAFFVAFKLPNFFRRLFAEGAFSAAFVPLFSGKLTADGKEAAIDFAEKTLSIMIIVLLFVTAIMQISMPAVLTVLAPGFTDNPEHFDMTVYLSRITFPYLFFIALVSLYGGVLNSLGKFSAGAFLPVLLNLCMIGALLFIADVTETPAHALALGVAAAGVVQFVWMAVVLRRAGMWLRLRKPAVNSEVKILLKRMVPGIIGAGVVQINVWIDVVIATLIPNAVSLLYYADRINQFPLAIIGTAIGTVLLPQLSRQIRAGEKSDAMISQNRAVEFALLFALPAAAALMVVAEPIIRVIFERGAFVRGDSIKTALALAAYSAGLPAFVLMKVLSPGFFANGDTKTPVKVAIVAVIINITLNLLLMKPLGHVGIAVATTVASWVNVLALFYILRKRELFKPDDRLKRRVWRLVLASVVMGGVLWCVNHYGLSAIWQASFWERIGGLVALVLSGMVSYGIIVLTLKGASLGEMRKMLRR